MKIINYVFQVVLTLFFISFFIYYLTGYDSAFEADQTCHAQLSNYNNQMGNYGCDHDTETHQWILYDIEGDQKSAKIIKKFRYKFL